MSKELAVSSGEVVGAHSLLTSEMVRGRPAQATQNHSRTALSHWELKTNLSAQLGSGSGSLQLISAQSRTGGNTSLM